VLPSLIAKYIVPMIIAGRMKTRRRANLSLDINFSSFRNMEYIRQILLFRFFPTRDIPSHPLIQSDSLRECLLWVWRKSSHSSFFLYGFFVLNGFFGPWILILKIFFSFSLVDSFSSFISVASLTTQIVRSGKNILYFLAINLSVLLMKPIYQGR